MTRSEQILNYIKDHIKDKGYSPSQQEIGDTVGLRSKSTTHGHLVRLEAKGLIKRKGVRAIVIVDQEPEIKIIQRFGEVPNLIKWQGRTYRHDPVMDADGVL